MKIILVSKNSNKLRELKALFSEESVDLLSIQSVFPGFPDPVENGLTFDENSKLKVVDCPADPEHMYLADDSGLCIKALDGKPGVFSARFADSFSSFEAACYDLLGQLEGVDNRYAYFECSISLKPPGGDIITVSGRLEGAISMGMRGEGGFGYDPIFIPKGFSCTLAEMSAQEKNKISHRGLAFLQLRDVVRSMLNIYSV